MKSIVLDMHTSIVKAEDSGHQLPEGRMPRVHTLLSLYELFYSPASFAQTKLYSQDYTLWQPEVWRFQISYKATSRVKLKIDKWAFFLHVILWDSICSPVKMLSFLLKMGEWSLHSIMAPSRWASQMRLPGRAMPCQGFHSSAILN